jgi:site-specific recombinase
LIKNALDDNIELLESMKDAVERVARDRLNKRLLEIFTNGSGLNATTAKTYVGILTKYKKFFEEGLKETQAFEQEMKSRLDFMYAPIKKRVRPTKPKKPAAKAKGQST